MSVRGSGSETPRGSLFKSLFLFFLKMSRENIVEEDPKLAGKLWAQNFREEAVSSGSQRLQALRPSYPIYQQLVSQALYYLFTCRE